MTFDIAEYTETAHGDPPRTLTSGPSARPCRIRRSVACATCSNVESRTILYLRDLLVTPSHKDPEVTAFLTMWAYEESGMGRRLTPSSGRIVSTPTTAIFDMCGWPRVFATGSSPIKRHRCEHHRRRLRRRASWGAIDGGPRTPAYAMLIEREKHPELTKLLHRIRRQESRVVSAFYNSQARTASSAPNGPAS